jgi:phosphoglycerate dehydrogenase-like enzyme
MLARDVTITNARGMHAQTIAEHVVALTLSLFRHLPAAVRAQHERRWIQNDLTLASVRLLAGSTVGVVGLGAIGTAVAKAMSALGARVEAIRRRTDQPPPEGVEAVHAPAALHAHLPGWDVVVIAAPHTAETEGLIGRRELALMKRDAVLINVARGQLLDEEALADALRGGTIGGAALDVFDHEPLEPASPLWGLPNLLITPHIAGNRPDYWQVATDLFIDNLRRYRAGEPLINVVDKTAGY